MKALGLDGSSMWEQGCIRGHPDNTNSFPWYFKVVRTDPTVAGSTVCSPHRLTTKRSHMLLVDLPRGYQTSVCQSLIYHRSWGYNRLGSEKVESRNFSGEAVICSASTPFPCLSHKGKGCFTPTLWDLLRRLQGTLYGLLSDSAGISKATLQSGFRRKQRHGRWAALP